MDKILHDPKDPKLWELWYIPYYGSCRILSISRIIVGVGAQRAPGCRAKASKPEALEEPQLHHVSQVPSKNGLGFRV